MATRRVTLEEWFLSYQLRKQSRSHVHLPGTIDVDVTKIVQQYQAQDSRPPFTAIVVKALGLAAQRMPALNRMYVPSVWGHRVVEFDRLTVNLPVALYDEQGRPHTSAMFVQDVEKKSVTTIREEIRVGAAKPIDQTRVTKLAVCRRNSFFNRLLLKAVYFFAYNSPSKFEAAGAGGLSVSSLMNYDDAPPAFHTVSYGPTALTVLLTAVREREGRFIMELGLGFNHTTLTGLEIREAANTLQQVLEASDQKILEALSA